MIYLSLFWDFLQGFSLCEATQHDPLTMRAGYTCNFPLGNCHPGLQKHPLRARGGQCWKWVSWRLNAPFHFKFPKQVAGKCQASTSPSKAYGAGKGRYVLHAWEDDVEVGTPQPSPACFRRKPTFSPSTDSADLKHNEATDLLLSGSRSKGEERVWASNKTKISWNKEVHLDEEKKKELCKSNDIFDGTKSILGESQALDPRRRFESSPWIWSTLNKTLTIH